VTRYDHRVAAIRVPADSASVVARSAAPLNGEPSPGAKRPSTPPSDPARDLAGALHEVSNALTVVLGWIERARETTASPADLARALDIAASRAAEARGIVRVAIGAEARAEHHEVIADLAIDALTGLEPELRRRSIEARWHVDAALAGRAVSHAPSVRQILTNLLLNASAMSPHGSIVRLDASPSRAGDRVIFSVIDAGPGVPPERRDELFSSGITTREGGAGIGLRHASALAEALGGALSLADLTDGERGARFELSWPIVSDDGRAFDEPVIVSERRPPMRSLPLDGLRVLLVEDDTAVVDLLDTALSARGADVVSVRHRRDLDRALASGRFDAVLFDISPIQDDVRGAVSRVRDASEGLRVIMISGSAAAPPALPEGWINAWVRKPFEVGEIVQTIAPPRGPST
jgi:CheY-like chemotaxis protein